MICPNCNKEIDDNSRFCKFCGVEFIGDEDVLVVEDENGNTARGSRDSTAPLPVQNNNSTSSTTSHNASRPAHTGLDPDEEAAKAASRKTLLRIIEIAVAVIVVAAALVLVISLANKGKGTEGKDYVTDAVGEEIDVGRGKVEMSIIDLNGTSRTITSDAGLLTNSAVLEKYTEVMNSLKQEAPAFTRLRYQYLPTQNTGIIASMVLPYIEKFVTAKDSAVPENIIAGNADKLPLYDSEYGCLLADAAAVKQCFCEVLSDDEYRLVMVLADELNSEKLPANAKSTNGIINGVFTPYDAAKYITGAAELAMSSINFKYHDCSCELIYNPKNNTVKSLTQTMKMHITAELILGDFDADIIDITEFRFSK